MVEESRSNVARQKTIDRQCRHEKHFLGRDNGTLSAMLQFWPVKQAPLLSNNDMGLSGAGSTESVNFQTDPSGRC